MDFAAPWWSLASPCVTLDLKPSRKPYRLRHTISLRHHGQELPVVTMAARHSAHAAWDEMSPFAEAPETCSRTSTVCRASLQMGHVTLPAPAAAAPASTDNDDDDEEEEEEEEGDEDEAPPWSRAFMMARMASRSLASMAACTSPPYGRGSLLAVEPASRRMMSSALTPLDGRPLFLHS